MDGVALGVLLLQVAIVATVFESLRRGNVAATVNAVASLGAAVLPTTVELLVAPSADLPTALSLWIAVAGFLHVLGMLGLYESSWWWDHLTHALSASLIGALFYAAVLVAWGGDWPTAATVTVGLTFAVGVFWELIELVARDLGERFDVEPVLVYYGLRDTALDLVFDLVGAIAVVGLDVRVFVPTAEQFPDVTGAALTTTVLIVLVGSALMALFVSWSSASGPRRER